MHRSMTDRRHDCEMRPARLLRDAACGLPVAFAQRTVPNEWMDVPDRASVPGCRSDIRRDAASTSRVPPGSRSASPSQRAAVCHDHGCPVPSTPDEPTGGHSAPWTMHRVGVLPPFTVRIQFRKKRALSPAPHNSAKRKTIMLAAFLSFLVHECRVGECTSLGPTLAAPRHDIHDTRLEPQSAEPCRG